MKPSPPAIDEAMVGELLAEFGIPSAAIGVLSGGEITSVAVGVKNLRTGEPATTDTIYQCGSMTKTWTAYVFLQFVAEGRADLDEPVRSYLPGFRVADPGVTARVTPRHLLNHTSGIEEDFGDPGEGEDVYARMVGAIADARQVSPLGFTHGYSAALGYAILARVMEVLDGKPWDAVMADRLFRPLGLTGTSSWPARVDPARAATGHIGRLESPIPYLPRSYGPGGNVSSTIGEVLTMASVLPIGSEMTTSRVPVPDPYLFGPEWALGLIVCDWHGRTVFASDGSTIGQNARLRILPDAGRTIAMLTNGGPREGFYKRVFNEILGAGTIPELPSPVTELKRDPLSYVGVYGRPGTAFEVTAEGERLRLTETLDPMHAHFVGKPERITYDLVPVSDTHFLMPSNDPREDTRTLAIFDFRDGRARYLHTNCRLYPRVVLS
ncbi:serine hydrolase domain-containing protein [Actinoplanes subtropicus]|uniref:serine hydrolase domain-containing protein n=1 Tax=Actinoplanes subtropicus TaxID=543632 RepID=UPI000A02C31F|nr:serine hydrolase domain-containing protein [Actinoplanes subtropicus]